MGNPETLEAIVIGSGFGGAVACCRLAQKWPGRVMLLERGRRYPKGSFPRSPNEFADNFWSAGDEHSPHPTALRKRRLNGLYDIRNYRRMDAVVSAGLGGGSLIYANVFLEAPEWVFKDGWPAGLWPQKLAPYYRIARSVLGARPIPPATDEPRRRVRRQELFAAFAAEDQRPSQLAEICVFFGNDYSYRSAELPLPLGEQEKNRYGAAQTSCTYCGECDVGCNLHAKNSLDHNYLYAAELQHGADIRTECLVERIVPLDAAGAEDSTAAGQFGYRVHYRDADNRPQTADAKRVIVAAGTLGTNELLLRCRDEFGTLPRLSQQLGKRFSGNGDFVAIVAEGQRPADPNYGPVITQFIDYGLVGPSTGGKPFILEDAAYPTFAAWYLEGLRPGLNPLLLLRKAGRLLSLFWRRLSQSLINGKWSGSVVEYFNSMLRGDLSSRSSILLFMGKDAGDGTLTLRSGRLDIDWPQDTSRLLYKAMIDCGQRFSKFVGSKTYIPQPTWAWPIRNNITVHPLGGCALADTPDQGVVNASDAQRGEVFGYQGLYVTDGALMPGSLGANPSATITAVAEWIAEGITGTPPDDRLGVPERHA